jgi:hypothetical protein
MNPADLCIIGVLKIQYRGNQKKQHRFSPGAFSTWQTLSSGACFQEWQYRALRADKEADPESLYLMNVQQQLLTNTFLSEAVTNFFRLELNNRKPLHYQPI